MSNKSGTSKLLSRLTLARQYTESSLLQVFHKTGVLENFTEFTGQQLCRCFNIAVGHTLASFIKKETPEKVSS